MQSVFGYDSRNTSEVSGKVFFLILAAWIISST